VEAKAVEDKHAERAHRGASLSCAANVKAWHRVPKTRAAREASSTGAERSTLRTWGVGLSATPMEFMIKLNQRSAHELVTAAAGHEP